MRAGAAVGRGSVAAGVGLGAALGWLAERRWLDPERRGPIRPVRLREPDRELAVTARDGTHLHVEVHGDGAAGEGERDAGGSPTIVFAHGWTMQLAFWRPQLHDLSARWRVVAYDQRGHGRSGWPAGGDWSAEALGADLRAVIEQAVPEGERCLVVGHSMGGMAVLALATADPGWAREWLAGSVLISTGANELFRHSPISGRTATLAAVGDVLVPWLLGPAGPVAAGPVCGAGSDVMFYGTREATLHPVADPSLTAEVEQLVLACPPVARARFAKTLASLDLSEGIPRVPGPVVVIVGERDRLTPSRQSAVVAAARPDAELVVLPGVGHMAPLETPDVTNARVEGLARAVLTGSGEAAPAAPTGE